MEANQNEQKLVLTDLVNVKYINFLRREIKILTIIRII